MSIRGSYCSLYDIVMAYGNDLQFSELSDEIFENLGFNSTPIESEIIIGESKWYRWGIPSSELKDDYGDCVRELYSAKPHIQGSFILTEIKRKKEIN